ncbi:ATP-binding protein [Sphingomonas naphthae]|uniref:histidine kinase n=1 Tax=Sphingomonas naphthae TaxID=1813468 RepID=A0ABY7TIQ8_9SPHN|nr:ATP-binding protein [Sphingomonas naphthae]WCT73112.1 ATP-binding protein [Sphingomonas naphthae]
MTVLKMRGVSATPDRSPEAAGRANMLLLIQLRWIAVAGQIVTILLVHFGMGIRLPLLPMLLLPLGAVVLNGTSLLVLRRRFEVANAELFVALLFDVFSLAGQLYLSGGATNPFMALFLLQVVLGAILLDMATTWAIVAVTSLCAGSLVFAYRPLILPPGSRDDLFDMHIAGTWVCFLMIAVLLVLFVRRIAENLRSRDARLAELRQQAAEEDHIVRMGLLASGAAHELGTPLSSLAVILNDWRHMALLKHNPVLREEIGEMQAAVARCKAILTGVLQSAGAARGEGSEVVRLRAFLDATVIRWRETNPAVVVEYAATLAADPLIVSDPAIQQVLVNVLENAREASPDWIGVEVTGDAAMLDIRVSDRGAGFAPEMLADIGKPYRSTKARQGGGLGLFITFNVMRKLGGELRAINLAGRGACVRLTLPLAALVVGQR